MKGQIHCILLLIVGLIFCLTACAATKAFRAGSEAAAASKWDEAVAHYQKAHSMEPGNVEYKMELLKAKARAAAGHFDRGRTLLKGGEHDAAILEFQVALALDPSYKKAELAIIEAKNIKDSYQYYQEGLNFLKSKREDAARHAFKRALELYPENDQARAEWEKLSTPDEKAPKGLALVPKSAQPITLRFRETALKDIFEVLSRLSGVNFVFDSDFRDVRSTIYLEKATFEQALGLILTSNNLTYKVISEHAAIIYPKTQAKMAQYQDLIVRTFYLSNIPAKQALNILRATTRSKDIVVNEELNAVTIRDTPGTIQVAEKVLEAQDVCPAEALLDVEILEVSRNKTRNLGLSLSPYSIGGSYGLGGNLISPSITTGTTTSTLLTFDDLSDFSGKHNIFVTLPRATLNFLKSDADTQTLANPRLRVKHGEKARIHIGDRVPVRTNRRVDTTGAITYDFQYQDVGIKFSAEPKINSQEEINLKVTLEVSTLGANVGTTDDPQYSIGTRTTETNLLLRDGEMVIMGGLLREAEGDTVNRIPLLGDIPLLGNLFSNFYTTKEKTDVVMSITPYIIRGQGMPSPEALSIWSGTASDLSVAEPYGGELQGRPTPFQPGGAPPAREKEREVAPGPAMQGVPTPAPEELEATPPPSEPGSQQPESPPAPPEGDEAEMTTR
ncbi:MAG: secretin N-terminal domain-containing protein [Thermodesulfobacteriota bacterium]